MAQALWANPQGGLCGAVSEDGEARRVGLCAVEWGPGCLQFGKLDLGALTPTHKKYKKSLVFHFIFLCMGFSLTLDQLLARKNVSFSSPTSSNKEVVMNNDHQNNGGMKPVQDFTTIRITQALNYNLSRQDLEKEPWNAFSHHSPVNVSVDGIPCILFWAKRITIKFKNQTWLDLTDETIGQKATVDSGNSNCSEGSAMLSLKFGDAENPRGIDIRFTLTSYKLSIQTWFSLHRVEVIFNNSIPAAFNATGKFAPSSYSYHCQRVSSLQQYDALLLPRDTNDMSSLWDVTFVDFQIQGFPLRRGQFAKARNCTSSFSPAIPISLAMSQILLLVLAYALHMLIYLRYLDWHYDFIASLAHFCQLKARDASEEKELLRSQGVKCYELRSQQICKIYV
ncbi:LOW QUALITY PROTEIN: V-type proton ATPase subunit S1-like protein [Mesoplodon densirostris]|uniref:LOW QUALITY PROTEIN: V-type proton ATPase subunit S1-like protein n=1 Tax=Mesoplodon densirostris TaxID=48708 RepID=UPI0028DC0211|nr:LOW QUALITY PROTEIN: V-type proton ATPase subunit S1-like protein [Mesoplodon densirostris]